MLIQKQVQLSSEKFEKTKVIIILKLFFIKTTIFNVLSRTTLGRAQERIQTILNVAVNKKVSNPKH